MSCPRCEVALEQVDVKSIRVDRCPDCGGSWYDAGELRLLRDRTDHGDYRWIDLDLWREREAFRAGKQAGLVCPKDGETLVTVNYGESRIRVDICTACRGLWLDKGEYEQIIEYLAEKVDTETVGDYIGDVAEEFVEVFTHPQGVRSELADLGKVLYLLQLRFLVQHKNIAAALRSGSRGFPG